jgi:hypothetical protein
MAAEDGSNVRFTSSSWRWRLRILPLVLHLLIVTTLGTIVPTEEPLTRISFGSCANQSAPQVKSHPSLQCFINSSIYKNNPLHLLNDYFLYSLNFVMVLGFYRNSDLVSNVR